MKKFEEYEWWEDENSTENKNSEAISELKKIANRMRELQNMEVIVDFNSIADWIEKVVKMLNEK